MVATVCTFSFKLTSGLDLVRMEQGNPRVWLAVMGFCSYENKEPILVVKENFIMEKFQNIIKVERRMNLTYPSSASVIINL